MAAPAIQFIKLAPQALLNCGDAHGTGSCGGGSFELSHAFIHEYGITDETCMPYQGVDHSFNAELPCEQLMCRTCNRESTATHPHRVRCGTVRLFRSVLTACRGAPLLCYSTHTPHATRHTPHASRPPAAGCVWITDGAGFGTCYPVPNATRYYVDAYGYVNGSAAMMQEIYERGPIPCSMYAHTDAFETYTGGVLVDKTPFAPGNTTHVLSLVGWGEDTDGTPYWIGRNSFGTIWGEAGWFRLIRGVNSLNIESHCGWAVPKLS